MPQASRPAPIGPRDVIAAWIVCFAVAIGGLFYRPPMPPPPADDHAAAPALVNPPQLCEHPSSGSGLKKNAA